ncbi:glycosyltransferase [Halotia branconii]|uniref:Glycosyltransferase n=1 Tax=Halotia branconii CENA392 TaxID=1539056 RepID=A0AAJ6NMI4_9CYAN|nr:glycosyltransferase [Halotia branconii]WGV23177.1 glycosyltransferase [Halotia branconii CENA392]
MTIKTSLQQLQKLLPSAWLEKIQYIHSNLLFRLILVGGSKTLAFSQKSADVAVASASGQYEALLTRYGVKHFQLNQSREPLNIIKAAWRYREILQAFQPDIVHAHMMTDAEIITKLG